MKIIQLRKKEGGREADGPAGLSSTESDTTEVTWQQQQQQQQQCVCAWVGKNPLEKEMGAHSSILAWEILWLEKPGGLQFMRLQKRWT